MKSFFLFLISLILGGLLATLFIFIHLQTPIKPTKLITTYFSLANAPSTTLQAIVSDFSGAALYQSRVATTPAALQQVTTIKQGENIVTKTKGNVNVTFANVGTIHIMPNSELDFIQMIPQSIMLLQPNGMVQYTKNGNLPVSVSALNLLLEIKDGDATVVISPDKQTVSISVSHGNVIAGYEDTNNNGVRVNIQSGNKFLFNVKTMEGTLRPLNN